MALDIASHRNIVVLTGAGVSAASGLATFRGPGGIWDDAAIAECGHVDTFRARPERVWSLFGAMRRPVSAAAPNAAHEALARLERSLRPDQRFTLITQNIDGLHQRAGSRRVVELHGNLRVTRCSNPLCPLPAFVDERCHDGSVPRCPVCGSVLRPDIVLFGETLPREALVSARRALRDCDLFVAAGTSGTVVPAADFAACARYAGARTVYANLEPMVPPNPAFEQVHLGPAETLLPRLFTTPG